MALGLLLIKDNQYVGSFFAPYSRYTPSALEKLPSGSSALFLLPDLTPLANESYSRVYDHLVKAQQVSELEELIDSSCAVR